MEIDSDGRVDGTTYPADRAPPGSEPVTERVGDEIDAELLRLFGLKIGRIRPKDGDVLIVQVSPLAPIEKFVRMAESLQKTTGMVVVILPAGSLVYAEPRATLKEDRGALPGKVSGVFTGVPDAEDSGAREVSLAAVYAMDMGRRTEDLEMWRRIVDGKRLVIEVGGGDGRIPKAIQSGGVWIGIETSREMLELSHDWLDVSPEIIDYCLGDSRRKDPWDFCTSTQNPDCVIVPYSTLFLMDEAGQRATIEHAHRALTIGGAIAIEVFTPKWSRTGTTQQVGSTGSPDGFGPTWKRESTYKVDAERQLTEITRHYGPWKSDPVYVVRETVHWRNVEQIVEMLEDVGFTASVDESPDVPDGHALIVGVK